MFREGMSNGQKHIHWILVQQMEDQRVSNRGCQETAVHTAA